MFLDTGAGGGNYTSELFIKTVDSALLAHKSIVTSVETKGLKHARMRRIRHSISTERSSFSWIMLPRYNDWGVRLFTLRARADNDWGVCSFTLRGRAVVRGLSGLVVVKALSLIFFTIH